MQIVHVQTECLDYATYFGPESTLTQSCEAFTFARKLVLIFIGASGVCHTPTYALTTRQGIHIS